MSNSSVTTVSVLAAFAVFGTAATATAQAKKKPLKPACGITAIPLIEGTVWTYKAVAPPDAPRKPLPKPRQPAMVIVKVVSVEPHPEAKKEFVITLEENAEDRVYTTKLRCKKDALMVPPESILFSGEPGGGLQITLGEVTRAEDSAWTYMLLRGQMIVPTWIEELKVPFTRTPYEGTGATMVDGSLDLQRNILIGPKEQITTELGTFEATPLQVDLRGSIFLDLEAGRQEFPVPANTFSKLWFADGVGVVQIYNTNVHMYHLTDRLDPNAEPDPVPTGTAGKRPAGAGKTPAAAKKPAVSK